MICEKYLYSNSVDSVIAIVEKEGRFGATDVMGRRLIDFIYQDLSIIGENKFKAKKEGKIQGKSVDFVFSL